MRSPAGCSFAQHLDTFFHFFRRILIAPLQTLHHEAARPHINRYPRTYQHDMTNTAQKAGKPAKALDAIELLTEAHQEIREAFKEYGRLITSGGEVR